MMYTLKFSLLGELRRAQLVGEDQEGLRYDQVCVAVKGLFPQLANRDFKLKWEDEDNDIITMSSDAELRDAIRSMTERQFHALRFFVEVSDKSHSADVPQMAPNGTDSSTVHSHVTCDGCGMYPLVGVRYKCTVRNDFDLCSSCEAKSKQPYPMIKIVDPSQAPKAILVTMDDEVFDGIPAEHRYPGSWRARGHHFHGPRGCRFMQPVPPAAESSNADRNEGCIAEGEPDSAPGIGQDDWRGHHGREGWRRRFHNRCERWEKKFYRGMSKIENGDNWRRASPFNVAMDSFVRSFQDFMEGKKEDKATGNDDGNAESDEKFVQEAIKESLKVAEASVPSETLPQGVKAPGYIETCNPAVKTLPKPALRFVRAVTYPDGTLVHPGAIFRKIWRVRNDGVYTWPDGVVLVFAGGDMLTDPTQKVSVDVLEAGKEGDIAVMMRAPECAGRFVSYFRMQTKDEQNFGQRLWADIVVVEEETEWQLVKEGVISNPDSTHSTNEEDTEAAKAEESDVTQVTACEPASGESHQQEDKEEVQEATQNLEQQNFLPDTPWKKELKVLAEMGFVDLDEIVPLLKLHIGDQARMDDAAHVDGMQRVVGTLLSRTGVFN